MSLISVLFGRGKMAKKKRKKGFLSSRKAKGRAIRSLAKTTPGGKGRISKRPRARKFKKKR